MAYDRNNKPQITSETVLPQNWNGYFGACTCLKWSGVENWTYEDGIVVVWAKDQKLLALK